MSKKKIAQKFGYELVSTKLQPTLECHLKNIISLYKIDLIIDVGANEGQFALSMRKLGFSGIIHSFEPVPKTFEILKNNCSLDDNWYAHQIALGDKEEEREVNVTGSSKLSSFLTPNDFAKSNFENSSIINTCSVDVTTLDRFIDNVVPKGEGNKILLKMDTQGFDLNVFKGAKDRLDKIACILSELSFIPIYDAMPHYLDALKLYENAGFNVTGLYPISRKNDLAVIEMDCVLTNSSFNTQI